jgi:hypothetical protein
MVIDFEHKARREFGGESLDPIGHSNGGDMYTICTLRYTFRLIAQFTDVDLV